VLKEDPSVTNGTYFSYSFTKKERKKENGSPIMENNGIQKQKKRKRNRT
jgi:hypothetical protein